MKNSKQYYSSIFQNQTIYLAMAMDYGQLRSTTLAYRPSTMDPWRVSQPAVELRYSDKYEIVLCGECSTFVWLVVLYMWVCAKTKWWYGPNNWWTYRSER